MKLNNGDESHGIQKFTVDVNANLEFTLYVYNRPISDYHNIYQERKRCLKTLSGAIKLLRLVTNSNVCTGLPQDNDAIQTVPVDPTWNEQLSHNTQSTVVSLTKFRGYFEKKTKEQCKPCSTTTSTFRKAETRNRKFPQSH